MKKIIAISIVSLLAVSVLIFPAVAAVTANSVSWDGGLDWLNQYQLRGWVEIYSYTGSEPTAHIVGTTNIGDSFNATVFGIGFEYSKIASCDLGSLPFVTYWDKWVVQH